MDRGRAERGRVTAGAAAGLGLLALFMAAAADAAAWETNVLRVLESRGVPVDREAARRGALEGFLRTVDPGAELVPAGAVPPAGGPGLETEDWPEGIRYLRVEAVVDGIGTQLVSRLRDGFRSGRTGVILDLRGAGGDGLAAVNRAAGLFTEPGTPLYEVRDGTGRVLDRGAAAAGGAHTNRLPLIVLTDGNTRGAAEVLAAVLRDQEGVLLVGGATPGETGFREMLPLGTNQALRITTRWVVRGAGPHLAPGEGLSPDVSVAASNRILSVHQYEDMEAREKPLSEKARLDRDLMQRVVNDPRLARAVDILLGLKALRHEGRGA
ncbi:MAG: hypothetical protein JW951_08785 [Lentisphaerae bacterium]|nr:hypothetical protein [Lentisphaerota bacterium]